MLQALFDRLRLTYEEGGYDVKDYALKIQEREAVKTEIAAYKEVLYGELNDIEMAEWEAEIAEIGEAADAEGETE